MHFFLIIDMSQQKILILFIMNDPSLSNTSHRDILEHSDIIIINMFCEFCFIFSKNSYIV